MWKGRVAVDSRLGNKRGNHVVQAAEAISGLQNGVVRATDPIKHGNAGQLVGELRS